MLWANRYNSEIILDETKKRNTRLYFRACFSHLMTHVASLWDLTVCSPSRMAPGHHAESSWNWFNWPCLSLCHYCIITRLRWGITGTTVAFGWLCWIFVILGCKYLWSLNQHMQNCLFQSIRYCWHCFEMNISRQNLVHELFNRQKQYDEKQCFSCEYVEHNIVRVLKNEMIQSWDIIEAD